MKVAKRMKPLASIDRNGDFPCVIRGMVCVGVMRFPGCSEQDGELVFLSRKQKQVLQLLADGLCIKQIADQIKLKQKGAEYHRARLYRMLGVSGIAELTKIACRLKLSRM